MAPTAQSFQATEVLNNTGNGNQMLDYSADPNDLIDWLSGQNLWSFPMADQNNLGF